MSDKSKLNSGVKSSKQIADKVNHCSTICYISGNKRKHSRQRSESLFVCKVKRCGKEFRTKRYYKEHWNRIHSDSVLRCADPECDYVTKCKAYLRQHVIVHSDYRPFICNTDGCGKTFKRRYYLTKHQRSHTSKLFVCTQKACEETFTAKLYLKRHINEIHSSTPKSYKCRTCGKGFVTKGKRVYHQRTVHQKLVYTRICVIDDCNKEFNSRYFFKDHIRTYHSGQENRCHVLGCGFVTANKYLMNQHLKTHSKSRPFVCGIGGCVKAFNRSKCLNKHKKTHSSQRFACNALECKKIFKTKAGFNRHMKLVHSIQY